MWYQVTAARPNTAADCVPLSIENLVIQHNSAVSNIPTSIHVHVHVYTLCMYYMYNIIICWLLPGNQSFIGKLSVTGGV